MALRGITPLYRTGFSLPIIRQSCPSVRVLAPPSAQIHKATRPMPEVIPWYERLPMTWRPSFWRSITPIPLRKEARAARRKANLENPSNEWNPATYFFIMFCFIGSFGIHFINLRQGYARDSRQADNRILALQEVLKRVQAGEDVDVEEMLGTGNPLEEQEWAEVTKRIAEEDRLWQSKERKKARRQAREAREAAKATVAT